MATRAVAQDPQVDKLRAITNTTQLVRYLHTELDWPVDVEDVDDAFFDWHPDELFLKDEHSVAIDSIKQLRPLTSGQPWGIFFVEFDRARLPIVVLRRVLNSLAIKRRASAKKGGGHQTWHARDLLFVSSFGETGHREIALAHFTDESEQGDLPVLRVLGWDEDDTSRQLEKVAATLQSRLRWPARTDGTEAQKAWREQWAGAFTLQYRQAINDAKSLALALAHLAKRIRVRANDVLAAENERGHLHKLHLAFKDNLIADLTPDGFADMFAQTIAYGLFTAHVSRGSGALVADDVALMVPSTNPFLRDLLQDFLQAAGRARQRHQRVDFDELGINDVVDLLRHAPMDDILRSFDSERPGEDPVIHFYEDFLKAYDKKMRAKRGVFYTPRPVVQFIVRSVHEILQTEFGIEDGLASTITWGEMRKRKPELALPAHTTDGSPFVQILDPATGTATFLVETIDLIHCYMLAMWRAQRFDNERIATEWNAYVREHLLPRLHGFELMMAPYAIAHMKIGLKLDQTGYKFPEDGPRVSVFLTNTLEPAHEIQPQLEAMAPMLAHEARSANHMKERLAATVIIGNPPYSGESANKIEWVERDVKETYQCIDGIPIKEKGKKNWLLDDYVKFLRFSHRTIAATGCGCVGHIINNAFQDNPTFRGLRRSLLRDFSTVQIVDLHGSGTRADANEEAEDDENVFDILQGVCVLVLSRRAQRQDVATVTRGDLWGQREKKYMLLLETTPGSFVRKRIYPKPDQWYFISLDMTHESEWLNCANLLAAMPINGNGLISAKDHFAYAFSVAEFERDLEVFLDAKLSDEQVAEKLQISDNSMWSLHEGRLRLRRESKGAKFCRVAYRPFDIRHSLFHRDIIFNLRLPVTQHVIDGRNLVLLITRMTKGGEWRHCFVSRLVSDCALLSNQTSTNAFAFPLSQKVYAEGLLATHDGYHANFTPHFVARLTKATMASVEVSLTGKSRERALTPEDIFHYMYAVFHCPGYRIRYAEFLKIDFPRIPVPGSRALFDALSALGAQLVQWHLLEHATATAITATTAPEGVNVPAFFGKDRKLLKVAEKGRALADLAATSAGPSGKVCINATSGFSDVRQDIWQHTIGSYQVLHKWLDDRRKAERSLSDDDIAHWRRVYAALEATQSLMAQVDEAIAKHGGWPDAFSQNHPPPDPATLAAQPVTKRPRAKRASTGQGSLFGDAAKV